MMAICSVPIDFKLHTNAQFDKTNTEERKKEKKKTELPCGTVKSDQPFHSSLKALKALHSVLVPFICWLCGYRCFPPAMQLITLCHENFFYHRRGKRQASENSL